MDPAIVSYRQFSFMNGPNQPAGGDLFLNAQQQQQQQQQMNQQQNLQPGQGICFAYIPRREKGGGPRC